MKTMIRALPILLLAFGPPAFAQDMKNCVSGTVQLSAAVAAKVPAGGTLFVYIRELERAKGQPSAVLSIAKPLYPQRFTLCGEDQMVKGSPSKVLAARYRVYARHSLTGKAMVDEGFLGESAGPGKAGVRAGDTVSVTIERPLGK